MGVGAMAPFGFNPDGHGGEGGDENERQNIEAMMRQMQEALAKQFEQLGLGADGANPFGSNPFGANPFGANSFGNQGAAKDALPIATVRDVAKKFTMVKGSQPLGVKDLTAIDNACEIADIWLNEATLFPAHITTAQRATSRVDWVDSTLPGWHATMEPLASGLASAISRLIDEALANQGADEESPAIPIAAISGLLRTFIATMIATQLGEAIGAIATTAVGAHDAGLPILEPAYPLLIAENIDAWGAGSEIAKSEIYLFHALRESAIARLFHESPWIVSYIRSSIVEYGAGIRIDIEAIQRQAEEAMEKGFGDNSSAGEQGFSLSLDAGIFTPEESPEQRAALSKLETVLALVDGWADDVATQAAGERLPSITALRELHRRTRATSAPSQELFKKMLGLEVSPKLSREASAFWGAVREAKGIEGRDGIWSAILPSATELLAPDLFLASSAIPDDLSGLF